MRVTPSQVPKKFKREARKAKQIWRYDLLSTKKVVANYYAFEMKNGLVWFPDQNLEVMGELGPKGEVLLGPETLIPLFNIKSEVSFFCSPAGEAGRYLPGRGAKDPFYSAIGNDRRVKFHGWVKGAKVIEWRDGRRSKLRIDYQGFPQQHIYLRKTHRKHNGRHIWRLYYK